MHRNVDTLEQFKGRGWMLNLNRKLKMLEEEGNAIKVGLVGAGYMGRGLVCMITQMKGMKIPVVADIHPERGVYAYEIAGFRREDIVVTEKLEAAERAVEEGKVVVTKYAKMVPKIAALDVVIEATGIPEVGANVAFAVIIEKKHVVMLNVEADSTVGPILKKMADNAGVVYTGAFGDEPGVLMQVYDHADALGFEIVVAGKMKYPLLGQTKLWVETTPETVASEAARLQMNPKMLCSFIDGTKTMVEMAQFANATGLPPDVRGMHGPFSPLEELPKIYRLKEDGGILQNKGVVDFAFTDGLSVGVFVVATIGDGTPQKAKEKIQNDLEYLRMGPGPNYLFYRPYHLCNIETPLSAARAVIYKEPTIAPLGKPVAEVFPVAKRDLKAGEALDIGGAFTNYGSIDKAEIAKEEDLLPLGLAEGSILKRNVDKGEAITYDMVELDQSLTIVQLRSLQDKLFG